MIQPPLHRLLFRTLLLLAAILAALPGVLAANELQAMVENHVRQQTRGYPGDVSISVGQLGPGTNMPPCSRMEAYTPAGGRLWGRSHVGIRCLAPNPWSVLLPVQIRVSGGYVAAARSLPAGQTVQEGDLATLSGDLTALPQGVVTEARQAVGKTLKMSVAAGQPLRGDLLLAPLVIRQGQTVRLISRGPGFSVSSEGKAINNAAEGQVAQIRMPNGQVVSGVAQADGTAETSF